MTMQDTKSLCEIEDDANPPRLQLNVLTILS